MYVKKSPSTLRNSLVSFTFLIHSVAFSNQHDYNFAVKSRTSRGELKKLERSRDEHKRSLDNIRQQRFRNKTNEGFLKNLIRNEFKLSNELDFLDEEEIRSEAPSKSLLEIRNQFVFLLLIFFCILSYFSWKNKHVKFRCFE